MNCWAIGTGTASLTDRFGCCACVRRGYADVHSDGDDGEDGGSMRSETCFASGADDDDGDDSATTTEVVGTPSPMSASFASSSRQSYHNCCCCCCCY